MGINPMLGCLSVFKRAFVCLVSFALVVPLYAGGESGAYFLEIKTSARATAMGEAFVSLADDASCLQWNPAGLASIGIPTVEFNHMEYIADVRYEYLAGVLPLRNWGSVGLGVYYSGMGDLLLDQFRWYRCHRSSCPLKSVRHRNHTRHSTYRLPAACGDNRDIVYPRMYLLANVQTSISSAVPKHSIIISLTTVQGKFLTLGPPDSTATLSHMLPEPCSYSRV